MTHLALPTIGLLFLASTRVDVANLPPERLLTLTITMHTSCILVGKETFSYAGVGLTLA